MPRLACASVSVSGSVGSSALVPDTVDENVPVAESTLTVDWMLLPDDGRRGVL